jgi:glycosyltransferase involved in cell wall biosynthesis
METTPPFFWLASFPRSGNTFVRNILYEVFGLTSGTWDVNDEGVVLGPACFALPVVKTHMLPQHLPNDTPGIKAVYLVRDGRDAMVSIAHHRSNIVAPGSDFVENLRAAIYAENDSFFGGWSKNVTYWLQRADLVIRYEDLIRDPAAATERIRRLVKLPEPDYSRIPSFRDLKYGMPRYGSGVDRDLSPEERKTLTEKNFRKGKAGAWQEEMPPELADLFWSIHGDTMLRLGYRYDLSEPSMPDPDLDWDVLKKIGAAPLTGERDKIRVLIEADKVFAPVNDGVKRYQTLLLKELIQVQRNPEASWQFDLYAKGEILPLEAAKAALEGFTGKTQPGEADRGSLNLPLSVKIQQMLLRGVPGSFKRWLERSNITLFHRAFDLFWQIVHQIVHQFRKLSRAVKRMPEYFGLLHADQAMDEIRKAYDLIHLPLQHHYKPFANSPSPLVVTIHDYTHKLFPKFHTPVNVRNAERGWKFAARHSAGLIAVSESTANDAQRLTNVTLPPIYIIHEAVDRKRFHHRVNSEKRRVVCHQYGIPEGFPFFFTLSSIEPRKNLEGVIAGFFALLAKDPGANLCLVIGGKKSWGSFHPHTITGFDPRKVHFTGFIDDEDLPSLCSEALAFCYISHYEGFGLPILEAMNCGTPIIYGNNSSMPEIVGEAGLPADARNIASIAEQMGKLFYDAPLREAMSHNALKQAARFSARKMALETLNAYRKTLNI